ncbi:uncharacterized protein LOC143212898 [Lasioglossum baleicum]|uniref:uncharacterized protein LOC143212898 n=1 Tax=Lasioglossum baleicum TaxID=434251 RepID=UPI003FCEB85A
MNHDNENDDDGTDMGTISEEVKTSYNFGRVEEEIDNIKLELAGSRKEYQTVEAEICKVTQLKNKALFILKDTQRKYNQFEKKLKEIHSDYMECVKIVNSYEKIIYRRIESLTLERNNLKNEIHELRKHADENNKKLAEIKKLITIQEVGFHRS